MIICMSDCSADSIVKAVGKVLELPLRLRTQQSLAPGITDKAQTIGHRNMTLKKVFRGMFPLQNEESAFNHPCMLI